MAESNPSRPLLPWADALGYGVVLFVNGWAGSGALTGQSIGVVATRYPNLFLPAGWVFGIWSLIYLWLGAFIAFRLLPAGRARGAVDRIGGAWLLSAVLNVGWVVTFAYERFAAALAIMVALLVTLVVLTERIGIGRRTLDAAERWWVGYPFQLYLAWISVALIANTFHFAAVTGWGGFGIPETVWSPVMMTVATALAAGMAFHRRAWLFPLVVAWALVGIRARHPEVAPVARAAAFLVAACLVLAAASLLRARRTAAAAAPDGEPSPQQPPATP